jgi:hypothetical protein
VTRYFILLIFCLPHYLSAQNTDARETLEWVKRRANRLDTLLGGAALSQEINHLNLQLWNAWQEFDAVAQMGLYCNFAREAAERGRKEADVLGYQRETDLNSLTLRALESRRQAQAMRQAADHCLRQPAAVAEGPDWFGPRRVLRKDAEIASLDLLDALSVTDQFIQVQKIEHAVYLLRSAEYLASTLFSCREVQDNANRAIAACSMALLAAQAEDAKPHLEEALRMIEKINRCEQCK